MKKIIIKYSVLSVLIIFIFIVILYKFSSSTFYECSFWYSFVLLLLAFFTRKGSSSMPFGATNGFGTNGQASFLAVSNEFLASKGNIGKSKMYNEYNRIGKFNSVSILFCFYGFLFLGLSLLEAFI